MYRKIAAAAAILTAGLTVAGPAFGLLGSPGANDRPHITGDGPSGGPTGGTGDGATTTTAKPGETPKPPTNEPHPTTTTTATHTDEPKPTTTTPSGEEHRDIEQLRLACTGGRSADIGATKCEWSPSHSPAFARYVLWRQDPGATQRRVVFQTTDVTMTQFYDKPLAPGTYTYGVLALDGANKGVGAGGPATATVPAPPAPPATTTPTTAAPKPGTTSLACHVESMTVICTWPASTSERFGSYRLYREVPGTPAQLRRTITDRNTTTATDGDVTPGATYKYRVVVLDTNGQPLSYGGPVTVTIPNGGGTGDAPIQ
jgi:hypothetical protein